MLSLVWLLATPWTVACQTPLSIEIFQSGILEWVAISYSKGSLLPRHINRVSCKSPVLQMNSLTDELQMNSDDTTVSSGLIYMCVCVYMYTHTHIVTLFPGGSDGKESTCNVGDLGLIPGLERTPGGHSNLLQYSCLENPHGERSLAVYSPWSCKESDTTEQLSTANEIPAIKSYRSHHSPDRHQNLCWNKYFCHLRSMAISVIITDDSRLNTV